jgi:hypothetical protein
MLARSVVFDVCITVFPVIAVRPGAVMSRTFVLAIRSDGRADGSAYAAAQDRTVAAPDF